MFGFRSCSTPLLRCFHFGYCWLLAGLLVAGCAGRTPQSVDRSLYKHRMLMVSGHVLDAVSRQPMPGVPITKNGAQTTTTEDGFFRLKYPAAKKKHYNPETPDVLGVYSLNYAGKAAIPADTTQRVTLLLLHNAYRFPPHGSLCPADSVHTLPCASPWQGLPGSQRAFLFQDSSYRQPHKVRAFTVRVGKDGFARGEPFRVRIYQYNGPDKAPGEDLLTENFVFCPPTEGVFTYDLKECDVTVSGSGFFLALESPTGSDSFYMRDPIVGYSPIGPLLRPPYAIADTRTWAHILAKGWQRIPATQTCWPLYESTLSVEVEPAH